jgi:hypothetical protein
LLIAPIPSELQLNAVIGKVAALKAKLPDNHKSKNDTKRLAAQHKHWFRAKFFQQYRLFFRYHQASKIIVYALGGTLRTRYVPTTAKQMPIKSLPACCNAAIHLVIGMR